MKIVIASDSFKGSLEASTIGRIGEEVIGNIFPGSEVLNIPMADGGEGTVDCLIDALNGEKIECMVKDPLLREIKTYYGKFGNSAIMEMASASGLPLVEREKRNILLHSTYGTGQMIVDAANRGCENIYIGIGGSATNDGGMGFASAIGVKFLDENKNEVEPFPQNFEKIRDIDMSLVDEKVKNINITVMCDVTNPLLGETGATYIFGRQKGADDTTLPILEKGMTHYIDVVEKATGKNVRNLEGAGAAGGLGAGLKSFTNSTMKSGIQTILDILDFSEKIKGASLVITGEGRMDGQSVFGKVPSGVGKSCLAQSIPCIAVVGGMGDGAEKIYDHGVDSIISTVNGIMSIDEAMGNAEELYRNALTRAVRMVRVGQNLK